MGIVSGLINGESSSHYSSFYPTAQVGICVTTCLFQCVPHLAITSSPLAANVQIQLIWLCGAALIPTCMDAGKNALRPTPQDIQAPMHLVCAVAAVASGVFMLNALGLEWLLTFELCVCTVFAVLNVELKLSNGLSGPSPVASICFVVEVMALLVALVPNMLLSLERGPMLKIRSGLTWPAMWTYGRSLKTVPPSTRDTSLAVETCPLNESETAVSATGIPGGTPTRLHDAPEVAKSYTLPIFDGKLSSSRRGTSPNQRRHR